MNCKHIFCSLTFLNKLELTFLHTANIGIMVKVFTNGLGVQSQGESYQRLKKMVLDSTLLNTQHYKVWIKGKVEQSRGKEKRPLLHLGVVAIKKGDFGSPSTKGRQLSLLITV